MEQEAKIKLKLQKLGNRMVVPFLVILLCVSMIFTKDFFFSLPLESEFTLKFSQLFNAT